MLTDKQLPDLQMAGVSGAAGGTYNNVNLDGVSRVNGPVLARNFKGNGVIQMNGDLSAEEMDVNGKLKINGSLESARMQLDGMVTIDGPLRGENCILNGMIRVTGSCELERFEGEGSFTVIGLLSAGYMDFTLEGQSKADEIGVESLIVRQRDSHLVSKLLGGLIPRFRTELLAKVIEGDYLELENTTADIVRGDKVIIGIGCRIGQLEYRSELKVHPGSSVGKVEKYGE
jgi:cytoskeletal protein CcmA (bactofilin family)